MPKTVSISWLKQKSGNYALKGIRIYEDARAYDSMNTFRDEDAKWLTKMLGAQPQVEVSGDIRGQQTSDDFPEWALHTAGQGPNSDDFPTLDWERASATLLRHFIGKLIEAYAADNDSASTRFQNVAEEANAALLATDAGTYYTLDEAHTVLDRPRPKSAKTRRSV
jgi:hypothetical protein